MREMVELAVSDGPDVLCLQELPVWAVSDLEAWSGYRSVPAIARPGLRPARVAGWITRLDNGLLRSAVGGQANAVLVQRTHATADLGHVQISEGRRERRVCQAVRVDDVVVANLHASSFLGSPDVATGEIERARAFAERLTGDGTPLTIAGDFNLAGHGLAGYSTPGPGIDQVLVRGASASALVAWPVERRIRNGRVLSDHAPVEVLVG